VAREIEKDSLAREAPFAPRCPKLKKIDISIDRKTKCVFTNINTTFISLKLKIIKTIVLDL
jgi:hypothetical protein